MHNGGYIDEWYRDAMVYMPNVRWRMIGCSMQDGVNAVKKWAGMHMDEREWGIYIRSVATQ